MGYFRRRLRQYSTHLIQKMMSDAAPGAADWIAWEAGSVVVDSGYPANSTVTAVRVVAVGGGAVLKIAGKRKTVRIR